MPIVLRMAPELGHVTVDKRHRHTKKKMKGRAATWRPSANSALRVT